METKEKIAKYYDGYDDEYVNQNVELSILHELIHIPLMMFSNPEENSVEDILQEQFVETMAKAFLRCKSVISCTECQEKINAYQLSDYIKLKEKSNKIKDVYLTADYFCLPSFYEGTPNVLCEAISCGLPVICSDVCDNSLYARDDENGILFNPHSVQDMNDKISKLLSADDETYYSYCNRSRQLAEELLSKKQFLLKYKMILQQ